VSSWRSSSPRSTTTGRYTTRAGPPSRKLPDSPRKRSTIGSTTSASYFSIPLYDSLNFTPVDVRPRRRNHLYQSLHRRFQGNDLDIHLRRNRSSRSCVWTTGLCRKPTSVVWLARSRSRPRAPKRCCRIAGRGLGPARCVRAVFSEVWLMTGRLGVSSHVDYFDLRRVP